MQPSTQRSEGRQRRSPAVSKQEGSAFAKSKAARHTSSGKRASAGLKGVTFADCQEEPACSKAPVDAAVKQCHTRAARRKRVSTVAQALQLANTTDFVPDTYAGLDGCQQDQAEDVKAAGKRAKRHQASKTSEDRSFIKQFAAEAHALVGSVSSSQRKAADRSLQERSTSPLDAKTTQDHPPGQSSTLPLRTEAKEPVMGSNSADLALASTQGIIAAQEGPFAPSPSHSTAPTGEGNDLLLRTQQHIASDIRSPMTPS